MARIDFVLIGLTLVLSVQLCASMKPDKIPKIIQPLRQSCEMDGYDVTDLVKPKYWQFEYDGACQDDYTHSSRCMFYFTFCHTLTESDECHDTSICQQNLNSTTLSSLGEYIEYPFVAQDVNGFLANFGVRNITNPYTNKTCYSSILMEFDCDKDAPWPSKGTIGNAPTPIIFDGINAGSCDIYMKFEYAGACYRIQPPTTKPATTVSPVTTSGLNPTPSKLCVPPAGYDISTLIKPQFWQFSTRQGCSMESGSPEACNILVAFCKPIESGTPSCEGGSACVRYANQPQYTTIVGNFTSDPFTTSKDEGFTADYPPGVSVINKYTNQTCFPTLSIIFQCDEDAKWTLPTPGQPGIAPDPIWFFGFTNTSCQISITVPYSGACKSNPEEPDQISAGSVLLIIFFVGVASYLLIGMGYNLLVAKESGTKVIPHYSFWVGLLLLSMSGASYTLKVLTCRETKRDTRLYDSVE